MKGLEPPRLAAPDPKSSASTNFATSAKNIPWLKGVQIYYFFNFKIVRLTHYAFHPETSVNQHDLSQLLVLFMPQFIAGFLLNEIFFECIG